MFRPIAWRSCVACLAMVAATDLAHGQNVIDAPPTTIPGLFHLNSGDVLNVRDGGVVSYNLRANDGSVVNVEGGVVGHTFWAFDGSAVNIKGGIVGYGFRANDGSVVNIEGGIIGPGFHSTPGSQVTISGGEIGSGAMIVGRGMISGGIIGRQFQATQSGAVSITGAEFKINGVPVTTGSVTLNHLTNADAALSGTLADGSPFLFSTLGRGDLLQNVTLTNVPIPAADLTRRNITTDVGGEVVGMRSGQDYVVLSGGVLPDNFSAVEATLTLDGGKIGRFLEVASGTVNLNRGSIGDLFYAYPGSTVNVDGGKIGTRFAAFDSEINLTSGRIGDSFDAHAGTTVNMTGGVIASLEAFSGSSISISGGAIGTGSLRASIVAYEGSEIDISGGTVGRSLRAESGSNVDLIGGEFSLNGNAYTGTRATLGENDVLAGTLSDGSAFIFSPLHGDKLEDVSLTRAPIAPVDTTPRIVNTPQTEGPVGLRPGQHLTLREGGVLQDNFAVVGATLVVEGGNAGAGAEVVDGTIEVRGGTLGAGLKVLETNLHMSSGVIGDRTSAYRGAVIDVTGGLIGFKFTAFEGSQVTLAGGTVGPDFRTREGSDVEFVGGEFTLNGEEYHGREITLLKRPGEMQVFSGVLSDGSPFIFSPRADPLGDELRGVKLTRTTLPAADPTPKVLDTPLGPGPVGLRPGQTLTVVDGGELTGNYTAIGATLNVTGGHVNGPVEVLDSTVHISGGEVSGRLQAYNSHVEISGGEVSRSIVTLSPGSTLQISGGQFSEFLGLRGGQVDISGGDFSGLTSMNVDHILNLFGLEFYLDGMPLTELTPFESMVVQGHRPTLSGILADGTPFSLNPTEGPGVRFYSQAGRLIVTLVPEPATAWLGVLAGALLLSGCSRAHRR